MVPGTPLVTTGILLASNAFVWAGGGTLISKLKRFSSKTYDEKIRPRFERMVGTRPEKISTTRLADTEDGRLVFQFSDVSIVDFAEISRELDDETTEPQPRIPFVYYDVKLTINNPDITIGEIDFSDWSRSDFTVTVTKKDGTEPLPNDSNEARKVLVTLGKYAKISLSSSLLPEHIAQEKIAVAGNWFIDLFRDLFDDQVRRQSFALEDGQNSHLREAAYLEGLITTARKRAAEGDYSVFTNYYNVIEHAIKNEQHAAKITRKKLEKEISTIEKARTKAALITAAIAIGVILIIATLIAISIINPTVGAILFGLLSTTVSGVVGFFGSRILASLNGLGVITLVFGIFKARNDFKREELRAAREELVETKAKQREYEEGLEVINKLKNSTQLTLRSLNSDFSIHPELDLQNKNIGDIGVAIICQHLIDPNSRPTFNTLLLSNNNITNAALKALGTTLSTAQTSNQPALALHTIDVSNNPIDAEGILEFSKQLGNNFPLTSFGHNVAIDSTIQDQIDKQLLINRYLQGIPFDKLERKIPAIFGDLDGLKTAAAQKLETNFEFTAFALRKNPELADTINRTAEQNTVLQRIKSSENPTAIDYVNALRMKPLRCTAFCANLNPQQIEAIRSNLAANIFLLRGMDYEQCRLAIKTLFQPCNEATQTNIDLLARIISNLPANETDYDTEYVRSILEKAFKKLDSQAPDVFRQHLGQQRRILAERKGIDETKREKMLEVFDRALYQELDDISYKKMLLEKQVAEHSDNLVSALKRFIEIYQTIPVDHIDDALATMDRSKIIEMVRADIHDGTNTVCALLRQGSLSSIHRQKLLKKCFTQEESNEEKQNKAVFLDTILGDSSVADKFFANPDFRENYLRFAFPWPGRFFGIFGDKAIRSFAELKLEAEKLRVTAMNLGQEEMAEVFDKPLQITLAQSLATQFPCLRQTNSTENFAELQEFLKDNFDLRRLAYPEGIHPEIKEFMDAIVFRNRMHDVLINRSQNKLKTILQVYATIEPNELRDRCLQDFLKIDDNKAKFLALVKKDVYQDDCAALVSLSSENLQAIISTALGDKPNSVGVASIATRLFSIRPIIGNEYIWKIFDYQWTLSEHEGWSLLQYVEELRKLETSHPKSAHTIEDIIQTGLRDDLIARFLCLRQENDPISFTHLQEELENNYYLLEFDTTGLAISEETQGYIDFICHRNLMIDAIERNDLEGFWDNYSKIPADKVDDALRNIDNSKILALVNSDLGESDDLSCTNLRKLDREHRINLLTRCFLINEPNKESALRKAVLIDQLLETPNLFATGSEESSPVTKLQQQLKTEIYWALTSSGYFLRGSGAPYYKFAELLNRLDRIAQKLPDETTGEDPTLTIIVEKLRGVLDDARAKPSRLGELMGGSLSKMMQRHPQKESDYSPVEQEKTSSSVND